MESASQSDHIYKLLRRSILALDITPGEKMTERGLEASFGASRTPARAALIRLESEGLARRVGRGWIASPIDLAEIRMLAEFREALETAAVRLAIERASDSSIRAVIDVLDRSQPGDEQEESVRLGGDFHELLARLSGNTFIVDGVTNSLTRLERTRWLEARSLEARIHAWEEHHRVMDAVAKRDLPTALSLVSGHIRGANERLLHLLSSERQRFRGSGLAIIEGVAPTFSPEA